MKNKLLKHSLDFLLILAMILGILTSCVDSALNGEPGAKGEKGAQGNTGANGKDGSDGITPQLRINGVTKVLKFYQNGTEIAATTPGNMSELTFKYFLGGYNSDYKFVGTIYYFHYVNKALDTDEFHAE